MNIRQHHLPPLATLLAVGLLSAGCGHQGYTFSTTATYDVPTLGFRADITAVGKVPPGADLSDDGTSRIVLSRLDNPGVAVATLQTSNQVASVSSGQTITYTIGNRTAVTLPWGSTESEESFRRILTAAGFTNDVPQAFQESLNAVSGPALGPKSTGVGSSTYVTVVKVKPTFQR
jgi:hypothetical protein